MPWLLIHSRDRTLLVRGAELGAPLFTREADRALQFAGQDAARKWIERHIVTTFGELALMRAPGSREGRKGLAQHYGSRARTTT
jgi:hypothetical protein